ncbi:UDP-4-amino-4,6-dideoxy-N-acetyl-beta-L-altrosamine transaminase [Paenibacillus sp. L3-i20]|uniref:UDP-4-amino-4, 6-dideoxy-N-acetyl-beta-L-altrosamine transaminase n=1 Tax=Paenibacillus sp. L3-i20 TaxID=2905833 RepID=UPI001EE0CDB0|nr:UDP-4-amino-4,6-dideoxy-N-acetyl-beta-L-altrosamine transaminase [Paenibacillus sp. L3-i20]GKU76802.1 UDP-4-amino-4,6-dideoxy-N-acetyl-beta-L-altrosami ne transaminase [Paenibacillus sp. L3-i20]
MKESIEQTRSTMLPYGKQWIDEDDIAAVVQVLQSDFITQGPAIERFERKVADYVGAMYAVAFCNGTAALHGASFAAGIGPGDEVITTPITFLASSNCVLYTGGKPVFADIDSETYNIDPNDIERKITKQTKAIIAVDFTGQPAEIDKIERIARKHNLLVIHDAAHSLGASYENRMVGSYGDMTMFSFHPVKHVTTGEGGVIVTNDAALFERLRLFRNHGMTRDSHNMTRNDGPWYYEMTDLGYNYRMTDMQAALGFSQMDKLDSFIERRRQIAAQYNKALIDMPGLVLPYQHPDTSSSWHLYVVRWDESCFSVGRNQIFNDLRAENIGVNVHYIPVYKQPYYSKLGYEDNQCAEAEVYYNTAISLPIFPLMSEQDQDDVIHAVTKIYNRYRIK